MNTATDNGAAEWVRKWDAGETIDSISMGGMSAGYEQVIQIITVEIVRALIEHQAEFVGLVLGDGSPAWREINNRVDKIILPKIKDLGCTGAQHGAAHNLAGHIYLHGPEAVMLDERVKDRHIRVSRDLKTTLDEALERENLNAITERKTI